MFRGGSFSSKKGNNEAGKTLHGGKKVGHGNSVGREDSKEKSICQVPINEVFFRGTPKANPRFFGKRSLLQGKNLIIETTRSRKRKKKRGSKGSATP